jgi:CBS domain-containing protein
LKVKDIMSKDLVYVTPEDNLSKILSLVEKNCLREILIIEKNILKGIVYSKDIAKKGVTDPTKTKASTLMNFPPPTLSEEDSIEDAARMIFKTGLRALPVTDGQNVVGLLSAHDIVNYASKTANFKKATAESVMSYPETVTEDTDIGKARLLMREKNISRIPVVGKNQNLVGIVTIFDLLKAIQHPREKLNFYSMTQERETLMGTPISVVYDKNATTAEKQTPLSTLVSTLDKDETDGLVVVENQIPVGVVTEKDLLEFYISTLGQKGIYYQVIGLVNEDEFVTSTVDRMIGDTLQKLSKIHNIQHFFMHVKRYDKTGKVKYSIRTRLITDKKVFISKSYAWDLRTAADEALHNLETVTIKNKEKVLSRKNK